MNKIQPPTNCPSCSSDLVWENNVLYCKNSVCPAQSSKRLEHFAKTLKIKGLGPASIEKLELQSVEDIYRLDKETMTLLLKSEKLAQKILAEIENSKAAPLDVVLPALSIPLVGKTVGEKLASVCESIDDINVETCVEAGLGPKVTSNLMDWIESEYEHIDLPFSFKFSNKSKPTKVKGVVCISGKLKSCKTKAQATEKLKENGYVVKPSLTKEVTILLNESGIESSKTKKARDSGVEIITNLNNLIGE